jgi:hypothetical protein
MTRKRFVWWVVIGVITVSGVVSLYHFSTQAAKLTERYEDPEEGIDFKYPEGWVVEKNTAHDNFCIANSRAAMQRQNLLANETRMCLGIEDHEDLAVMGVSEFKSAFAMAQAYRAEWEHDLIVTSIVGPKQLGYFPYDAAQVTVSGDVGGGKLEYITIIIRFDDQHVAWFTADIPPNTFWWNRRKYKATFLAIAHSIQFTKPNSALDS